jgi:acyl carrier protein
LTALLPDAPDVEMVRTAMTPDRYQLEADLIRFVQSRGERHAGVTSQTDLIESGLLDSLLLVDLILYIEELCGIKFESDQVNPSNFRTMSAIVDLVLAPTSAARH